MSWFRQNQTWLLEQLSDLSNFLAELLVGCKEPLKHYKVVQHCCFHEYTLMSVFSTPLIIFKHTRMSSLVQFPFHSFCLLYLSLTLTPCIADPPQVTVHPVDQTNIVPESDVSFSVTATGTAPLSYQWQKDGVNLTDGGSITGATTATLTITGVMESNEGGYRCVVTNIAGMVTSNTAMLTVGKLKLNNHVIEKSCKVRPL